MRKLTEIALASTIIILPALALALSVRAASEDISEAYNSITGADLGLHIKVLASDHFEGREPGTPGELRTIEYLKSAFARLGVQPAMNGSYFQDVPLLEMRRSAEPTLSLTHAGKTEALGFGRDFVAFAGGASPRVDISNIPLVFAGYGVTAPEQNWNDYDGLDVKGKAVVLLRGEPYREGDRQLFSGKALTRHGIQPTKYENAARHGARIVIMVHTEKSAGYPWSIMTGGGADGAQHFIDHGRATPSLDLIVHVNEAAARAMFQKAGQNFDQLWQRVNERTFRPISLQQAVSAQYAAKAREIKSRNVVAMIPGSSAPDECVVYTAHWDHLGKNDRLPGDRIFNGAVDNATGTAALLELAQAYSLLPGKPRRTIIFLATTAEEKGLLGAEYHAEHPACPLPKIVAVLNLDALFPYGPYNAMTVPGLGSSEIEDVMAKAAARIGRVLQDDSEPQAGAYYRSDHYPFAKRGVPAIFAVGNPRDTGNLSESDPQVQRLIDYVTTKYHKVTDQYDERSWDLRGVEGDVRVYFETGLNIAQDSRFPAWYPGNEFKGLRDEMRR